MYARTAAYGLRDALLLGQYRDHPARMRRIEGICAALPALDIDINDRPYSHAQDLERIVNSLIPTICQLHGKEEPREFMALFDAMMDIWDKDVPHLGRMGELLPIHERREVGSGYCTFAGN